MDTISNLLFHLNFFFHNQLIVNPHHAGFYFDLFYLLAFLLATIWMLREGHRKKIPLVSWLLVLALSRLFFIIGTKVSSYSAVDWLYFFQTSELVPTRDKVILGGFLLGLIAFWAGLKIFRLPIGSLDAMAIAIPLSIFLQRIGCFILGCCFGTPTDLSWGVRYSFGTPPHMHQFRQGLIQASTDATQAIHPFQLYEALNGLTVALLVFLFRKKIKTPGNLFLFTLGTWALNRSIIEFFRDPVAHVMGGEMIFGLKIMQWMLLATMVLSFVIFFLRKKKVFKLSPENYFQPPSLACIWFVLLLTVSLTWSLRNWLTMTEMIAMNLMLYPAIIISAVFLFKAHTVETYRWLTLAVMILPVFLMSQTLESEKESTSTTEEPFSFFNMGFSTGEFYSQVYYAIPGSDTGCGPSLNFEDFKNNYWNAGFGYGKENPIENGFLTYGINGSFGQYTETKIISNISQERFLFALNPYLKYDTKWVGLGVGLYVGNNYWADSFDNESKSAVITTSAKGSPIYPQGYFRIGPESILFGDIGIGNAFPSPFPGMRFEAAIGSGFGLPRGNKFRIGGNQLGAFVQGNILFSKKIQGSATYQWGKDYAGMAGDVKNRQFFMGIQYRIYK